MLRTRITELFGIQYPIVAAGMGGVAGAELAAAVSEAGGLGTIGMAGLGPAEIHEAIAAARARTTKPLAVNLLIPFLQPDVLEQLRVEPIQAVTLFWGDPSEHIPLCKQLGFTVVWQCGSAEEAAAAKKAGADAVIVQGFEAGGHVRGTVTTLALVPEARDAVGDSPMLAAGGFADGRGLAAALALGADAAVFGTRFLASDECSAHRDYKKMVVKSHAVETVHTKLFDVGWPDAAHRVIRTKVVEEWEKAGRPETGKRPGEGEKLARLRRGEIEVELPRYSAFTASTSVTGDMSGLAFYAGQSVSMVREIRPAGEIVREIAAQAEATIAGLIRTQVPR
ncbi:MAG TPA: nitronate monooxygenase [Candidatus Binataceae bacterium]|nr:nitronate monooxygenase [Candidatus Binataceae bacterium]